MSNEKYQTRENFKAAEKVKPNFTHEALGTFKDPETGEWQVAVIKYDPTTGVSGDFTKVPAGGKSRDFANERFKIEASDRDVCSG